MKAKRQPTNMVIVKDGEKQFEYNLHYKLHKEQLVIQVGKQVMDLLEINSKVWIDCHTLEIEE